MARSTNPTPSASLSALAREEALPVPQTMRAWTHKQAGSPSAVLSLSLDVPSPSLPSATAVLVRISHASLSPGGSIMMQLCPAIIRAKPCIPELDFAGRVVSLGSDVSERRGLRVGDDVFGSVLVPAHRKGAGALAELVALEADGVVSMPLLDGLEGWELGRGRESAAGLGVSGCTALALLEGAERKGLKMGMKVLVNGASGGIGTMIVQLVKRAVGESGQVVAICSGKNADLVRNLGADEVIDYTAYSPVHTHLAAQHGLSASPFDLIIDCYGIQDLWTHCASYLSPKGAFITVGVAHSQYTVPSILYATSLMLRNSFWPTILGGVNRPYVCVQGFVTLSGLEKLRDWVGKGELQVVVDSVWKMEDALLAYDRMLSRHARGKVIVKVQDL